MSSRILVTTLLLFSPFVIERGVSRAPQQPTFETQTFGVVVDVVVRDGSGTPVMDLGKGDFELFEDGVRQDIADVTLVSPSPTGRSRADAAAGATNTGASLDLPAAVAAQTFVALVFDRLTPEARVLAYTGALSYLEAAAPDAFIGVFLSDLGLATIQPYTNDRQLQRRAVGRVARRATSGFETQRDHERYAVTAGAEFRGRDDLGDAGASAILLDRSRDFFQRMERDQQGYASTNALMAVAAGLSMLPGRKTMIVFAQGLSIPANVLPRFRDVVATANGANVTIYAVDADGLAVHSRDAETAQQVRAMGNRGLTLRDDGSTESDLRMLEVNEEVLRRNPRVSLSLLAEPTGGFVINNTNDLSRGLGAVETDRRFHYLLTYTPKKALFSGEWRNVTVRVPKRRVDVRARSGYLAVRALGTIPVLVHEGPALAALETEPRPADLPIRAGVFIFPGDGETRLAVLASAPASALTFIADGKAYRTDFTIVARIRDPKGAVVRKASEPYRLNGPLHKREQAQQGEVLFFRQPSLPPGRYTLEVAVFDVLARKAGVETQSFEVPSSSRPAISSLIVVERGERVPPSEEQKGNPLYVGDVLLYPNLGQPISKKGSAPTFFLTVIPHGNRTPAAELELLRSGQMVARLPLVLDAPVAGRIQQLWQVPIAALPEGDYVVKVTVSDGPQREVRQTVLQIRD